MALHSHSHSHTPSDDEFAQNQPNQVPDVNTPAQNIQEGLSHFIAARIELASIEAKEAAEFTAKKAASGIIFGLLALFTWALLLAALTGALAPFADRWLAGPWGNVPGWAAVLFVFAFIHGIAAIIFYCQLKKGPASPFFELSKKEIENDKQWLNNSK